MYLKTRTAAKREKSSNETATNECSDIHLQHAFTFREETQKKRRSETRLSVQGVDLWGSKIWLFPLIWDSSCSSVSPPAVRTLNHPDIYADKIKKIYTQLSFPAFLFQVMLFYFLSPFLSFRQLLCFTITRRDAGSLQRSTLLTSSAACFPLNFPHIPICQPLPRLSAFDKSG